MRETRSIEIDFDVHKAIEADRKSFSETDNEILRRLSGIGGQASAPAAPPPAGRPWSGKGVTLPHGTELRMEYNGRQYTGLIDNGIWLIEGKRFSSPSGGGVRRCSIEGRRAGQPKRLVLLGGTATRRDKRWTAISLLRP